MSHAKCQKNFLSCPSTFLALKSRDLRIVFFFVRIESRIELAVRFVFESNLLIESAVYTTQAVTRPDGLQVYGTGL